MSDVRVMGRSTQGVKLANLKEDFLIAIQKVEGGGDESETIAQTEPETQTETETENGEPQT